jgi:hypothetical protein
MHGPGHQTRKLASTPTRGRKIPVMIDVKQAMLDPTSV